MVDKMYPKELLLSKTPYLDLNLSRSDGIITSKIYKKRDDLDLAVNFPFLDDIRYKQSSTKNSGPGSLLMQELQKKRYREKYEIPLA